MHSLHLLLLLCRCCLLQDLQQHPNNGWSLLGLQQVAEARGRGAAEAAAARAKAWEDAEVQIDSSCPALAQPFTG
jgi:hypothetical protein